MKKYVNTGKTLGKSTLMLTADEYLAFKSQWTLGTDYNMNCHNYVGILYP